MASPGVLPLPSGAFEASESKLLASVGFEKSKIGAGARGLAYQIKQSSLKKLLGILFLCFLGTGILLSSMGYDIRFEKRSTDRRVRHIEHRATNKLAKVDMELLSEYHDDEQESHQADMLLHELESAYTKFRPRFDGVLNQLEQGLHISQNVSAKIHKKILNVVSKMQQEHIRYSKHFLNHVKQVGKHAAKLKKNVEKQLHHDVQEEKAKEDESGEDDDEEDLSDEELNSILEDFFSSFHKYDHELGQTLRDELKKNGTLYGRIQHVYDRILNGSAVPEEVFAEIDSWNLRALGANFTIAPRKMMVDEVEDMMETFVYSPYIPDANITMLEKDWRSGKADGLNVFTQLESWKEADQLPDAWWHGEEDEEEEDEDEE